MMYGGLRVVQTTMATQKGGRVKVYPKRKSKSPSHWRRMDKKMLKRFGFRREPCAYQMGDMLMVHPSLMPQIRAAIKELAS